MTKIQLTLTAPEANLLSFKATQLGYNLTRFIKFLISKEASKVIGENNIPSFIMSKKAEKIALQARKDYQKGKAIKITSFRNLKK